MRDHHVLNAVTIQELPKHGKRHRHLPSDRKRNASHEPKHAPRVGASSIMRLSEGKELVKILEARADPKRENAEQELAGVSEECSLLAAKRLEERAVRDQRVLTRLLS